MVLSSRRLHVSPARRLKGPAHQDRLCKAACRRRGMLICLGHTADIPERPEISDPSRSARGTTLTSTTARALAPGCFSAIAFSARCNCVRAAVACARAPPYEPEGSNRRLENVKSDVVGSGNRRGGIFARGRWYVCTKDTRCPKCAHDPVTGQAAKLFRRKCLPLGQTLARYPGR